MGGRRDDGGRKIVHLFVRALVSPRRMRTTNDSPFSFHAITFAHVEGGEDGRVRWGQCTIVCSGRATH